MGLFSKGKGKDDNGKDDNEETPEDVAANSNDAYCTECHTWYDAGNNAQVNRHAH